MDGAGTVGGEAKIGESPKAPQVMGLGGIKFSRAGGYNVNFWLNDSLEHQIDFGVNVVGGPSVQPPLVSGEPPPQLS